MIRIPEWLYEDVADRLREKIGCRNHFCGTIEIVSGCIDCRLTASLIVCRHKVSYPEGDADEIQDLVPVWWKFHTYKDMNECMNDFKFDVLQSIIREV